MKDKSGVKIEECIEQFEIKVSELEGIIKRIRGVVNEYMSLKSMRNMTERKISSIESKLSDKEEEEELFRELESERYELMEVGGELERLKDRLGDFDDLEALEFYLREKKPEIIQKVSRMQAKLNQFKEEVKKW